MSEKIELSGVELGGKEYLLKQLGPAISQILVSDLVNFPGSHKLAIEFLLSLGITQDVINGYNLGASYNNIIAAHQNITDNGTNAVIKTITA